VSDPFSESRDAPDIDGPSSETRDFLVKMACAFILMLLFMGGGCVGQGLASTLAQGWNGSSLAIFVLPLSMFAAVGAAFATSIGVRISWFLYGCLRSLLKRSEADEEVPSGLFFGSLIVAIVATPTVCCIAAGVTLWAINPGSSLVPVLCVALPVGFLYGMLMLAPMLFGGLEGFLGE